MKNTLSQIWFRAQTIDERTIRMAFVVFALVFAIVSNSPTDGTGGIR